MFNVKWCGDITGIRTNEGKLYLASAIYLFSLRLLGYAMRGGNVAGVIFHTDGGSIYTAGEFTRL